MAVIEKRGDRWRARIRIKGGADRSQSFATKAKAIEWADRESTKLRAGESVLTSEARRTTLAEVAEKYLESPEHLDKKSAKNEAYRVRSLAARLGSKFLSNLRPAEITSYRNERLREQVAPTGRVQETKLKEYQTGERLRVVQVRDTRSRRYSAKDAAPQARLVSAQTVLHELNTLSSLFRFAADALGIQVENPIMSVARPKLAKGRDRRARKGEMEALLAAAAAGETKEMGSIITLAVESAMRLGELLALQRRDVDLRTELVQLDDGTEEELNKSSLLIRDSKNGTARSVPISLDALVEFQYLGLELARFTPAGAREITSGDRDRVFGNWANSQSFDKGWRRCLMRAASAHADQRLLAGDRPDPDFLVDFHFHDLRHEATSRLFERPTRLSLPQIMSITGHKSMSSLNRYAHAGNASDLASKLG